MPRAGPKIFCIGFHKTGTTSLGAALEALGYRVRAGIGVREPRIGEIAMDLAREQVPRFDAFQDNPWPILYRELDAEYPNSRFILTCRETESWLTSITRHFGTHDTSMREWIYGVGHPVGYESLYAERFAAHNRDVRAHFENRPSDLLEMDLEKGDGWNELCRFLEHPVPRSPFPHRNPRVSLDRSRSRTAGERRHRSTPPGAEPLDHVIFTPFCTSKYFEWKAGIGKRKPTRNIDLTSTYIENRLRYLESICFPSIRQQTNQNFTWIVAIDAGLPDRFLEPLEAMVASRPRSFLHEVDDARLERIDWMRPYLSPTREPSRLVTTNLDSDDGLDRGFTRDVQRIVSERSSRDGAPPILIVGFLDCVQWDLNPSWSAPFGWRAKSHRGSGKTLRSAGYTVAARYPDYPVLVTGVRHVAANRTLDFSVDDPDATSPYSLRRHACELAGRHGHDLRSWSIAESLVILDEVVGPPLMLNHPDTIQNRLAAKKRDRKRVWGRRSLPNVPIDWNRLWGPG